MSENIDINLLFNAYDNLSSAISSMERSLGGFRAETEQVTKKTSMMRDALSMAAGIMLRDFCRSAAATITESVKLGAQLETLKNSFYALSRAAGGYVPSLEQLRKATKGMVSDTNLLKAANQAMMLGLPTEELDQLMINAIKLGNAMGIDATHAVESLSIGIGRQSRLVLDNLGVVFNAADAYEWYAQKLGVSTDKMDENTKKQAWMQYAIKKVNDRAIELGDNISETQMNQSKWNASIDNLKTSIGGALGPVNGFVSAMEPLTPMIGIMAAQLLPQLISKIKITGSTAATAAIGVGAFFGGFLLAEQILSGVPEELRRIAGALTAVIGGLVAATAAWFAFHGAMAGPAAPFVLGAMLASIGAAIVGVKEMLALAEGGIVTKPTVALIGEAGPEAVVPLDRAGGFGETIQHITIYPTINVGNISTELDLEQVHDVIVAGLGDGVNRYIAEKFRRRT